MGRVLAIVRRVPFTTAYVVVAIVLGVATGALWAGAEGQAWFRDVAYGLPAFEAGRWLTIAWGSVFALTPLAYAAMLVSFAAGAGLSEWRLGTRRTILIIVIFQAVSVLLSAALLALVRDTGWEWAHVTAAEVDLGLSAGMLAAVAAASTTIRAPWGLRLRLLLVAYALFAFVLLGQLADLEHLVAIALSLPIASRLAGDRAVRATPPPKGELRLITMIGMLVVAASQLFGHVIPERQTPVGDTDHTPWSWLLLLVTLGIWLLIARGLRKGRRWAWWIAFVATVVPIVLIALAVGVLVLVPGLTAGEPAWYGVPQFLASATMYIAFLVVLLVARPAFGRRGPAQPLASSGEDPDTARRLLKAYGGCSTSWMTTWPRMRHMVTTDGQGFIGFRWHAGVAIALGDPVGPAGSAEDTIEDFIARCAVSDVTPFLFSCTRSTMEIANAMGWQSVQIAEDNIIDLPDLEFTGKKWQNVRTALNKAPKEGVAFRLSELADEPPEILEQVERVSSEWLDEKALPEMGFTLGGVPEALDRDVRVGLAVDGEGRVHGVTSWLPAYGPDGRVQGWTLDVMRRIDFEGSFRPTMEFLIASSCLAFKEQGASYVSLSGAPLARSGAATADDGLMEQLLDTIGALMEPLYGFRSLHAFKAKFQPRLDPMYMAFRDEADLPRIGIAITRAFLPDAGIGDVVGVVKGVTAR